MGLQLSPPAEQVDSLRLGGRGPRFNCEQPAVWAGRTEKGDGVVVAAYYRLHNMVFQGEVGGNQQASRNASDKLGKGGFTQFQTYT